jgi:hypothetical protein
MSKDFAVSPIVSDKAMTLHADNVLDFFGQKFTPDDSKGYFHFSMSHAFPVRTHWGTGIHPIVAGKSFNSLLHQNLNWEHHVAEYYKKPGEASTMNDRIIGMVVATKFPDAPIGGWKISKDSMPAIDGVASYAKRSQGMAKIVGDHSTGRHKYTVSMEVEYPVSKSGLAVANPNGKLKSEFTPDDIRAAGFEYWPWASAPADLQATFSTKVDRVVAGYKGQEVTMLMGGLDGSVHYCGLGLVKYGAEPTAKIQRLTASGDHVAKFVANVQIVAETMEKLFLKK